ncbi:PREDICTED: deoxyribonuclease-2-alpha isoform X3 [Galeopterus variegatus]|nr:PREDICTED: deoxyribonuclease-2-alpha isoform X3 [Galeopterus variegatus]
MRRGVGCSISTWTRAQGAGAMAWDSSTARRGPWAAVCCRCTGEMPVRWRGAGRTWGGTLGWARLQENLHVDPVHLLQLAFLLYNDQPPKFSKAQDSSSRGHTKGVLLLDQEGGLWLVHSVPRFPPPAASGAYSWPYNARPFGQTLLCVSFPLTQFQRIGRQLTYAFPLVYDHKLEGVFAQKFPDLEEVVKGHHVRHAPWNSSVTLTSQAGATFQSFAKSGSFGDDLYSGWLATALGSNLQVQFWQNSPGILPSNCSGTWHVLDVTQTAFPGPAGPTFNATEDHSKWCVALEGPWTCVGDMNRNLGEEHRGGGTLCTQLPALWKAFQPLVKAWEPCREESRARRPSRAYKS